MSLIGIICRAQSAREDRRVMIVLARWSVFVQRDLDFCLIGVNYKWVKVTHLFLDLQDPSVLYCLSSPKPSSFPGGFVGQSFRHRSHAFSSGFPNGKTRGNNRAGVLDQGRRCIGRIDDADRWPVGCLGRWRCVGRNGRSSDRRGSGSLEQACDSPSVAAATGAGLTNSCLFEKHKAVPLVTEWRDTLILCSRLRIRQSVVPIQATGI